MKKIVIHTFSFSLLFLVMLAGACTVNSEIRLPESVLTPIPPSVTASVTATATLTLQPTPLRSATALPSPTPTPRAHEVKLGETLGGIAWTYGVSLDSLLELNPEINPNAMKVGITVLIPAEQLPAGDQTPQPTAVNLPLSGLNCLPNSEGGIWCFGWLENTTNELLESALINVNIADLAASDVRSATAVMPLNTVRIGEELPFSVYFPAPSPGEFQSSAQFSSAIPLEENQNQFPRINLIDVEVAIQNESAAQVSGRFELPEGSSQIWIVAVAENAAGEIIGLRRWESGEITENFAFTVYAVSGQIETVRLFAEGQP